MSGGRTRRAWAEGKWLLVLAALAAGIAFPPLFRGRTAVPPADQLDIANQAIGFAAFIRDCYLGGHFPLWDPHDLCGMPFLAFPHTGSLYALGIACYLAASDYALAGTIDIFLHLVLAASGAYLLIRIKGQSAAAAMVGAVAYAYCGFMYYNLGFPPSLHAGAWLPWWWAGAFALLDRPRRWNVLLAAGGLAAMVAGGDLEMVIYAGLGLGFELILRAWSGGLRRGPVLALAASGGLGALLMLAQVLPSGELFRLSVRAQGAFGISAPWQALRGALAFPLLAVTPPAVTGSGSTLYYFGAFIVIALAAGLIRKASVRRRLLVFPAAGALLILLYVEPFNRIGATLPLLGALIVPYRIMPVLTLHALLAAAEAQDDWAGDERAGSLPLGRVGGGYLLVLGLAALAAAVWRGRYPVEAIALAAGFIAVGSWAALDRRPRWFGSARARAMLAIGLVALDLYGTALALAPSTNREDLRPDPRAVELLQDTAGMGRYLILSGIGPVDKKLPFHLGLRLHADTIDAHSRVPPLDAAMRLARLYPGLVRFKDGKPAGYDQLRVRDPANLAPAELGLLNDMAVVRILSRYPWKPPGPGLDLTLLHSWPELYVYQNHNARPEARATAGGVELPMILRRPAADAMALGPPALPLTGLGAALTVAVADSYYPGWTARAGGRELRIERTDDDFLRFTVPAPEAVTLAFTPASFRIGLWTSLAALAGIAVTGLAGRRRRGAAKRGEGLTPPGGEV